MTGETGPEIAADSETGAQRKTGSRRWLRGLVVVVFALIVVIVVWRHEMRAHWQVHQLLNGQVEKDVEQLLLAHDVEIEARLKALAELPPEAVEAVRLYHLKRFRPANLKEEFGHYGIADQSFERICRLPGLAHHPATIQQLNELAFRTRELGPLPMKVARARGERVQTPEELLILLREVTTDEALRRRSWMGSVIQEFMQAVPDSVIRSSEPGLFRLLRDAELCDEDVQAIGEAWLRIPPQSDSKDWIIDARLARCDLPDAPGPGRRSPAEAVALCEALLKSNGPWRGEFRNHLYHELLEAIANRPRAGREAITRILSGRDKARTRAFVQAIPSERVSQLLSFREAFKSVALSFDSKQDRASCSDLQSLGNMGLPVCGLHEAVERALASGQGVPMEFVLTLANSDLTPATERRELYARVLAKPGPGPVAAAVHAAFDSPDARPEVLAALPRLRDSKHKSEQALARTAKQKLAPLLELREQLVKIRAADSTSAKAAAGVLNLTARLGVEDRAATLVKALPRIEALNSSPRRRHLRLAAIAMLRRLGGQATREIRSVCWRDREADLPIPIKALLRELKKLEAAQTSGSDSSH